MAFGTGISEKSSKFSISTFLGDISGGNIQELDIDSLLPYRGGRQPFSMYSDEKLAELADSIRVNGLLQPILVRPVEDGKYEILAGHNRVESCKLAGLKKAKSIILENLTEEQASLVVTDTNLCQREKINPSERAAAYAMQQSALEKMGVSASAAMAEQYGESQKTVLRYIKLSKLSPSLLKAVDEGQVTVNAGAIMSQLPQEGQEEIAEYLKENPKKKVSETIAARIIKQTKGDSDYTESKRSNVNQTISIKLHRDMIENSLEMPQEKLTDFFLFCLQNRDLQQKFLNLCEVESSEQ